jgi:hypothetical protein
MTYQAQLGSEVFMGIDSITGGQYDPGQWYQADTEDKTKKVEDEQLERIEDDRVKHDVKDKLLETPQSSSELGETERKGGFNRLNRVLGHLRD